jgi:hypothetical protein
MNKRSRAEAELDALIRRTQKAVKAKQPKGAKPPSDGPSSGLTQDEWDGTDSATEAFRDGKHRDF